MSMIDNKNINYAWLLDGGSSTHITFDKNDFVKGTFRENSSKTTIADGTILNSEGYGQVKLQVIDFDNKVKTILFESVKFAQKLKQKIISESQMMDKNYRIFKDSKTCKIYNETFSITLQRNPAKGNLFHFKTFHKAMDYCSATISEWHERLGHANVNQIRTAANNNSVEGLEITNKEFEGCETCLMGKQARAPIPKEPHVKTTTIMERIHSDICGPLPYQSEQGHRYFITYIDEATDKCWIYMLKAKSEHKSKFLEFKVLAENQSNKKIKKLRTDNAKEFLSNNFQGILKKSGIIHETTHLIHPFKME